MKSSVTCYLGGSTTCYAMGTTSILPLTVGYVPIPRLAALVLHIHIPMYRVHSL